MTDKNKYPYACPKCDKVNATRTNTNSEENWVTTSWECDECHFEWHEHFEFKYWEQKND